MESAGIVVKKTNPFMSSSLKLSRNDIGSSPHSARLELLWHDMQEKVSAIIPATSGLPENIDKYIDSIDNAYIEDAYHSLSIEGYQVTRELIEKVKKGEWNPNASKHDSEHMAAMACKGYEIAFKAVRDGIKQGTWIYFHQRYKRD